MLRKSWMVSWMLAIAVTVAACGQKNENFEQASKDYVAHFQAQADKGAFSELYAESAPMMKAVAKEDEFISLLTRIQGALGERRRTTFVRSESSQSVDGAALTRFVYATEFEKGNGEESFHLTRVGDKPRLFHYEIDSPALRKLVGAQPNFDDAFGQAVLVAIARFHEQVGVGEFAAIYDAGAPGMQESVTKDRFVSAMRRVTEVLGARGTSTPERRDTVASDDGIPLMQVDMDTRFAEEETTERFFFQHADGKALLYRYEVMSERVAAAMQADDGRAPASGTAR